MRVNEKESEWEREWMMKIRGLDNKERKFQMKERERE